jgi:hypothetical protein
MYGYAEARNQSCLDDHRGLANVTTTCDLRVFGSPEVSHF